MRRAWPKGRNYSLFLVFTSDFPNTVDWRRAVLSQRRLRDNRCAIRRADVAISAPLAIWGQSRGRECELAGAPSRGFRLLRLGARKRDPPPLVCPSLISPSLIVPFHLHHYSPGAALAAQARAAIMATKRRDRAIFGHSAPRRQLGVSAATVNDDDVVSSGMNK